MEEKKKKTVKNCWWKCLVLIPLFLFLVIFSLALLWYNATRPLEVTHLESGQVEQLNQQIKPLIKHLRNGTQPEKTTLSLTEQELNGYLDHTYEEGKSVHFELKDGYLLTHVYHQAPEDVPAIGGTFIRCTAHLHLSIENGLPQIILSEVKCFNLSVPKTYLQGYIKKNLYPLLKKEFELKKDLNQMQSIKISPASFIIEF